MNNFQYFDIQLSSIDKRSIKGIELANKIKIILISDPDINMSSCSIAVGAGYLQDEFNGTAHFLEHLLFMGSEKYPEQNDYHSYVQINGGYDNAFTSDSVTCYYLSLETTFLKKGIEMLSWFFKSPLLDEKHISSEMEIIDSEHKKNILNDNWIMDDIFKNFIKPNSKYKKFGTGNKESLNKITKEDILKFYNKYYTTDNIFACVVDSKSIEQMISDYLIYFEEIPLKIYNESSITNPNSNSNDNRFIRNNFETIKENIIFYNTTSEYIFLNFYLIIDSIEKNTIDYQLILFINYLIGNEYNNSLSYYLKENNIVKNMYCTLEYFYDFQAILNLQLILTDKKYNNFLQTYQSLLVFINLLKNISEEDFMQLYTNFAKIKMLNLLYDSTSDPVSISNMVVENMIKGDLSISIIRNDYVPEYKKNIYNIFLEMVNKINIKITTNFNFMKIDKNKFLKSKWYNSTFYIDNISTSIFKQNKKYHLINKTQNNTNQFKLTKWDFDLLNVIGIKNFQIKKFSSEKIDKSILPELIYLDENLKRKIYLQEFNKFGKPLANITIIRRNIELLKKQNKILMGIYVELCNKILNYFLDTMSDYRLSFSIGIDKEYIIYNFYGINYQLLFFTSQIISKIHPDTIFSNENLKKYFNEIIRDIKESINNFKYNSPYQICSKYISYLLDNNFLPDEKLNFVSNLTFENFKNEITECFKYTQEYYILTGIKKHGGEFNIGLNSNSIYNYNKDNYMVGLIEMLAINPKKYLIKNTSKYTNSDENKQSQIKFENYKINANYINPNEINNCIIRYWCLDTIDISNNNLDNIDLETGKKIIKKSIVLRIISEILNEPLFDKIRTIDKLGYIVKCDFKIIINNNKIYYLILFLIQSSYSIKKISTSIEDFNEYIIKDLKTNYQNYLEKFRLLKESKLLEFSKPIYDLSDEVNIYIEAIVSKLFYFNFNKLFFSECKKIEFETDIAPEIKNINRKKSIYSNIILEKKID